MEPDQHQRSRFPVGHPVLQLVRLRLFVLFEPASSSAWTNARASSVVKPWPSDASTPTL